MVAKEETIAVLSPGSSEDNPDGSLKLMYKELQVTSPLVAKRKFTCLRTCKQIDQGTWVVADISYEPILNLNGYHSNYRRLPSGCLIQSISEKLSKVTWVEHMEVEETMPNHTLYDHLIRSGLAFGAERMLACLERWHEKMSHLNDICRIRTPDLEGKVKGIRAIASGIGKPLIMEKTTTRMCYEGETVDNENVISNEKDNGKSPKSAWTPNKEDTERLRKSANKFVVLEEIEDVEVQEVQEKNGRNTVDKFVKYQRQPTLEESKNWSKEMFSYFKKQWEAMWNKDEEEIEDVYERRSGIACTMAANEVNGKVNDLLDRDLGLLNS
ncbi:homeobox-leucine zipper protein HDG11 [Artemisia annua]|uniref:Homeobox-leucine zipper protein HDG11 n=1 Tax=Artemisia annua TaxID=35608 RepID=A0A2U1KN71_ARTAN|nr:homeobox-leucine zipper protein HDG11 [Artemisia annua]